MHPTPLLRGIGSSMQMGSRRTGLLRRTGARTRSLRSRSRRSGGRTRIKVRLSSVTTTTFDRGTRISAYKQYRALVEDGFMTAAKFLRQHHVYRVIDLPYQGQLVPFAAILAKIGDKWDHATVKEKLARWYWCGIFGELYGSAIASRSAKDRCAFMLRPFPRYSAAVVPVSKVLSAGLPMNGGNGSKPGGKAPMRRLRPLFTATFAEIVLAACGE